MSWQRLKRFRSYVILGAVGAAALLAAGCLQVTASTPVPPPGRVEGITVSGEGRVSVRPDVVVATLGVNIENENLNPAQEEATQRMSAAIERIKALGVDEKDIRTRQFSVQPFSEQQPRPVPGPGLPQVRRGYRVTNIVTVRIRDITKAGQVLDAAVAAGANRVDSIVFTVDNPTPLREQAREQAIKAAQAKADQMARLLGVGLGKVVSVSEGGGAVPFEAAPRAALAAPQAEVPISPGEMEIVVTVNVNYAIQ